MQEARFQRQINALPTPFEVDENVPLGSEVARVHAIDADIGPNAAVAYEIINGNEREIFNITSHSSGVGIVQLLKPLDREQDEKFLLTVRARNARKTNVNNIKYLPYDRTDLTQIQIEIRIRDVDDNAPRFERDNYVVGVKYNADLNTPLVTFHATDPDVVDVKPTITYHLLDAEFITGKTVKPNVTHVFGIEPQTGMLRNEISLRSYLNGYFNITVQAKSGEANTPHTPFSTSLVNCKVFILRDKDFLKFVFKKQPNEINKSLKQLENDFSNAMAASPLKLALNFDGTQYHQRRDGSFDFESSSACFQLIRSTDSGSSLVLDHQEGVKFLRPESNAPYSKSLRDLYDNYSIISIEECVTPKHDYQISKSEIGILLVGVAIALFGVLLACMASSMKKKLKTRMVTLGVVSGYNGPMFIGSTLAPVTSPYGVPIAKTPSFISVAE